MCCVIQFKCFFHKICTEYRALSVACNSFETTEIVNLELCPVQTCDDQLGKYQYARCITLQSLQTTKVVVETLTFSYSILGSHL